MQSTLSKDIEGGQYKEDLNRNEMFSSNVEGPFLKIGNVYYGASMHNIDPDTIITPTEHKPISNSDTAFPEAGSTHLGLNINAPVQSGAGKASNSTKASTKKGKQTKKKTARKKSKKTTTKKSTKSTKGKKSAKGKKPSTKKSPKSKTTSKKSSKKKNTKSKQKASKKK